MVSGEYLGFDPLPRTKLQSLDDRFTAQKRSEKRATPPGACASVLPVERELDVIALSTFC